MVTHKVCSHCGIDKALEEFSVNRPGKGGRSSICKVCRNVGQVTARSTPKAHEFCCAACGEDDWATPEGRLYHDWAPKAPLICAGCKATFKFINRDPGRLRNMIDYLALNG